MATDAQHAWNSGRSRWQPPGHVRPKLTAQQREEIRLRRTDGATLRELAAEFGVSPATIHRYS
jgi:DNA invertase Pin-like site-specific DNA recombinase